MRISNFVQMSLLSATAVLLADVQAAYAGDVTNAVLACYVDTNALEQFTNNRCRSVWTPSTGSDPTDAVFQVFGTTAGSYSYTWTDLETGQNPGCSSTSSQCVVSIGTDVSGDGIAQLQVVVRDTATNATKTVTATARYFDGWH